MDILCKKGLLDVIHAHLCKSHSTSVTSSFQCTGSLTTPDLIVAAWTPNFFYIFLSTEQNLIHSNWKQIYPTVHNQTPISKSPDGTDESHLAH